MPRSQNQTLIPLFSSMQTMRFFRTPVLQWLTHWHHRTASVRALRRLDSRQLRDIGLIEHDLTRLGRFGPDQPIVMLRERGRW